MMLEIKAKNPKTIFSGETLAVLSVATTNMPTPWAIAVRVDVLHPLGAKTWVVFPLHQKGI